MSGFVFQDVESTAQDYRGSFKDASTPTEWVKEWPETPLSPEP